MSSVTRVTGVTRVTRVRATQHVTATVTVLASYDMHALRCVWPAGFSMVSMTG